MTLYILDIIHGKIQTHTIHISSVTVDQIIANLEHRLQALTLGLWMQWPGGPVDLKTDWPPQKTYWPPQKLTGPFPKTKLVR